MSKRTLLLSSVGVVLLGLLIVTRYRSEPEYPGYGSGAVPPFKDVAPSNTESAALPDFAELKFVDLQGSPTDLAKYRGQKNVVLVITRGLTGTLDPTATGQAGGICVYCATQTSRIAANYSQFAERNAEVVLVFPVVKSVHQSRVVDFNTAVKNADGGKVSTLKFPLVFDPELKVVDLLGIRKDLSKPATYILDQAGKVRYAYVGSTLADRPSVKALLEQLEEINKG